MQRSAKSANGGGHERAAYPAGSKSPTASVMAVSKDDIDNPDPDSLSNAQTRTPSSKAQSRHMTGDSLMSSKGTTKERLSSFIARQTSAGPKEEARLQLAIVQRETTERYRPISAGSAFTSLTAFRSLLAHRFGSVTAAWRQLLDPHLRGKLSFVDFCTACRDIGFCRKMKQLWAQLDTEKLGYIQLDQLDAEAANALREFRRLSRQRHGTMLQAWQWFDSNNNHRVDPPAFQKCCRELGITSDIKKLFLWLRRDTSRRYLTIQDFDEQAMQCLYREDSNMMSVKMRKSESHGVLSPSPTKSSSTCELAPLVERPNTAPAEINASKSTGSLPSRRVDAFRPLDSSSQTILPANLDDSPGRPGTSSSNARPVSTMGSRWLLHRSQEQIRIRQEAQDRQRNSDKGAKSLEDLKKLLVTKYGSMYTAWRNALDLDGNGRLSFGEFCLALRNLGFGGVVKDVWCALDVDNDGFISLEEFDKETHHEVTSYKELVCERFGCMLKAWNECLNTNKSGQIDEVSFIRHCADVGWEGNPKHLFSHMKQDKGRRFLTLRDYDTQAFNASQRGDLDMLSEDTSTRGSISQMTFHERQDSCFSQKWTRFSSKMDREDMKTKQSAAAAKDKAPLSVKSVKTTLIRRYGTITMAWKHGLDVYGNGRVPFGEFCNAMRRLGFAGNIQQIFSELDINNTGAITLHDLDPVANQLLLDFRRVLLEKFGTYIKAWAALDSNHNGTLEECELVAECQKLKFRDEEQAKLLFKYLLGDKGKTVIHMADLDPAAMQAYYRGDLEALSPLEKAKKTLANAQKARQAELDARMGASDWKTLKKELVRLFGSITAAWRNRLDTCNNGKLSFTEFSKACRDMGFLGNIQRIFGELDDDASGIITFNEVDAKWFTRLSIFQNLLVEKFQSLESAWRALDANKNNMLEEDEFAEVCATIGYTESSSGDLFRQLRLDKHNKYVSFEDIDCQGVILGGVLTAPKTPGNQDRNSKSAPLPFRRHDDDNLTSVEKAKMTLSQSQALRAEEKSKQLGANDAQSLKQLLIRKYGSIVAAWRHGLDFSGNGKCSFVEFSKACRDNGFSGNIKAAFDELDYVHKGIITFDELDPEWYAKLCSFRDLCQEKFGDFASSIAAFDTNGNNMIEVDEVADVCKTIGYTGSPQALFNQLRKDQGCRHITIDDLNAQGVISWAATRFDRTSSKGTANDPKAQLAKSSELNTTIDPRRGSGGKQQTRY